MPDQEQQSRAEIFLIFGAVFLAGIASLQMELSLLRESTFVLGSTAFTNSFIISVFLGGLALGAYVGSYLVRKTGGRARFLFVIGQAINIAVILLFVFTKGDILYGRYEKSSVLLYFAFMTIIPSTVAGVSFSLFLNMLYGKGEKFIAWVYAVSTVGNVLSGFVHGMVLIPEYGMASTYIVAVVCSGLALLLVAQTKRSAKIVALASIVAATFTVAWAPPYPSETRYPILWSKDDIHGLVQVLDVSERRESYDGGPAVDLRIDGRHQCATTEHAVDWEFKSVELGMQLLGDRGRNVLNAGYCSGASVAKLLDYPSLEQVISIDMNKTVLEAAKIFFPEFDRKIAGDHRSTILIEEFRSYLKRVPTGKKFDMVVIDIAVKDPYYHGMFTREFFAEIKTVLADRGVVFWHKKKFVRTGGSVFPYTYRPRHVDHPFYYFTTFEMPSALEHDFERYYPERKRGTIYADHDVYELDKGELAPPLDAAVSGG